MSGRIFYVSLLNHFDAAETEFLRSRGVIYREIGPRTIAFPRVHVECDYLGPLGFDDLMHIGVTVERVGRTSFTLAFEVSVEGRSAARGKVVVVCMDGATQRAIPLPEKLRAALCS